MKLSKGILTAFTVCGTILLGACSHGSNTADAPFSNQVFGSIKEQISLRRAPKNERPQLTRAALNAIDGSFLEVTIEKSDVFAFLAPVLERRDAWPGKIVVWQTEDNVTLTMRDGVLVGTRGLRNDIVSSSVLAGRDGRDGPLTSGTRVYDIRGGDSESRQFELSCAVSDEGLQNIEIVELTLDVRHIKESCTGQGNSFSNEYWIDDRTGQFWQSRQWAGPETGYLFIRKLTN